MNKPEIIREHDRLALCVLRIPLEGEAVPHLWGIGARSADQVRYFDGRGRNDAQFSDGELNALCAWWQARHSAPVLDKSALEALVKRWRESAERNRVAKDRYPPDLTSLRASVIRAAGVFTVCADELEALLSSAKPDVLIASPITAELVWTEAEIREAILAVSWMKFGWKVEEVQSFIEGAVEHLKKGDDPNT